MFAKEEDDMSRKAMTAAVFFSTVLLTNVPAWSATPCQNGSEHPVKSIYADLDPVTDDVFNMKINLVRGGNGGNGGGNGGNGGQGGNGGNGGQGGNGDGNGGQGGNGNGGGDANSEGPQAGHSYGGADEAPAYGPGPNAGPGDCDGGLL
jgi:hypothetical protein